MTATETTAQESTRAISVTDAAVGKVADLIEAEASSDELVLRVAVRPGGCSGFSYEMYFDSEIADDDTVESFEVEGKVAKVAVDPTSVQLLKGATLDYKDGLNQAGFSINNPNAQRTCGCGQSFS